MASLAKVKGKPNKKTGKRGTTWRIDFFLPDDPKRKHIRLGKMSEKQARSIKTNVELLIAAKVTGTSPDLDVLRWVASRDDTFNAKLVEHGLAAAREKVEIVSLADFLDSYISERTDIKPNTRSNLKIARNVIVSYFGEKKPLHEITLSDADDFRRQLKGADNTIRRICGRAKQFFRAAVRKRLIAESPFADMKGTTVRANRSRDYFVSRGEAQAVLVACPDNEWRLLFALCRYGGLRCPSEPLAICWGDVDWAHDRITINSPKTGPRTIPIFPELRPYLEKAWDEAEEGTEFVITRYRDRNCNLRTQLCRIIKKAKLVPWPKLFQNLRSTRETELLNEGWKIHQVCAWIGNSEPVAMEHYLQVTEADFSKAAGKSNRDMEKANGDEVSNDQGDAAAEAQQKAQQNTSQDVGMERQGSEQESENPGDFENRRDSLVPSVPRPGELFHASRKLAPRNQLVRRSVLLCPDFSQSGANSGTH